MTDTRAAAIVAEELLEQWQKTCSVNSNELGVSYVEHDDLQSLKRYIHNAILRAFAQAKAEGREEVFKHLEWVADGLAERGGALERANDPREHADYFTPVIEEFKVERDRASGALVDAGTVPTEDLEAGIRALTAERDRLRELNTAYEGGMLHDELVALGIALKKADTELARLRSLILALPLLEPEIRVVKQEGEDEWHIYSLPPGEKYTILAIDFKNGALATHIVALLDARRGLG